MVAAAAAQLKTNGRLTTADVTLVLRKSLLCNERVALEHFEQFNQETMASPGLFNCYKEKNRQKKKIGDSSTKVHRCPCCVGAQRVSNSPTDCLHWLHTT